MFHLILVLISLVIFFVISYPFLFIEWLIGKKWPHARDISTLRFVQGYAHVLLFLSGTKLTVIGKENIPKDQPVLYIGNHRSLFDVLVTLIHFPGPTGYLGKKEFEKMPLLNIWLVRLHGLFLDRTDIKQGLKTILAAIDMVKNQGISVFIFPEGTRSRSSSELELLPFHEGSFKVSLKSGCPIVPVAINGTSPILEEHFPWIRSHHVIVEYGRPIQPNDLSKEDRKFIGKYVQGVILDMLARNEPNL